MFVGDALFVPSGAAVTWRAKGVEDEAMAVRFCYVDASNFDSVKTQLPIYAAVEVNAAALTGLCRCLYPASALQFELYCMADAATPLCDKRDDQSSTQSQHC